MADYSHLCNKWLMNNFTESTKKEDKEHSKCIGRESHSLRACDNSRPIIYLRQGSGTMADSNSVADSRPFKNLSSTCTGSHAKRKCYNLAKLVTYTKAFSKSQATDNRMWIMCIMFMRMTENSIHKNFSADKLMSIIIINLIFKENATYLISHGKKSTSKI